MSVENTSSPVDKGENRRAVIVILGISLAVEAFLIWLIYGREPLGAPPDWAKILPAVNASLNGLSGILVVVGLIFIKRGLRKQHATMMILATISSFAFLVCYLLHKYYAADTRLHSRVESWLRFLYLFILASHVLLSGIVLPMVFSTLFFASTRKFLAHKKIAKWTYPAWLYVSVTGVIVYVFLEATDSYQ